MEGQGPVIQTMPSELSVELRKVWAYSKKEFLIEKSYTFAYLFSILSVCTTITTYFFIDRLFGRQMTSELASFGTPYFAYVLVGNAFFAYVGTAIGGIAGGIGSEQTRGTLEVLLGTPTRLWVLLLDITIWNTLYASIEVVLYFFVGAVGFDVNFSRINWSTLACFLALVIIVFNSIGLIEAAWTLVFKRGTVAAWAFNGLSALLGGVFFPVTVLPGWLQQIAAWNPLTHAIRGLQMGIYQGTAIPDLAYEVGMLGFFCAVLVPLAVFSWSWGLRHAKEEGSLCLH
jgi:ABC-2 type transport system permease protein